ncbi:FAD binding domain-containing protein [Bacillus sp. FSL W8-0102]|uniref:FAD binding domain-containing protein n=1 Tax=Bacillus sp. FSL W8-0102 TaxID=2978205 RepID=UPI0030FC05FF
MISFDFEYYKPSTLNEAVQLFYTLQIQKKRPIYFSGGTEIITLGRLNLVTPGAVIDIHDIPECKVLQVDKHHLVMGAALTLTEIEKANVFPLLSKTASEVADHTARNKITLGGNICGKIFYREAVLPFLLTNSQVVIAGPSGIKRVPIQDVFYKQLRLQTGEFLVQIVTNRNDLSVPSVSIKKRRQWDTGYPLVTIAAMKTKEGIRTAFSGLCPFPFRSKQIEDDVNYPPLTTLSGCLKWGLLG